MPLSFEDLLAAKVALQLGLVNADQAKQVLSAADTAGQRFSQALEPHASQAGGQLPLVDVGAQRLYRLKSDLFYMGTLKQQPGVDMAAAEGLRDELRQRGSAMLLGDYLVQQGVIVTSVHDQVQQAALTALANDDHKAVERNRSRAFEGIERPSPTIEAVVGKLQAEGAVALPPEPSAAAPAQVDIHSAHTAQEGESFSDLTEVVTAVDVPAPAPPPPAPAPPPPEPPVAAAAADPDNPLTGTGLEARFVVERKLGEGGMGAVYLAHELDAGREVALKLVLDRFKSADAIGRFKREILATAMCDHPNVIEIYDADETGDGAYFMAMELVPGEELLEILKQEQALEPPRAAKLLEQILMALTAVHGAGIIHRDIKPENFRVWTDPETGDERVKIMDFGIAHIVEADQQMFADQIHHTMAGFVSGSPAYIAPEAITDPNTDARADLYSLGISFFYVLRGKLPFNGETAQEFMQMHLQDMPPPLRQTPAGDKIPDALSKLILKLLEKEPDDRFQTAEECLADLQQKVLPSMGLAPPPSVAEATMAMRDAPQVEELREEIRAAKAAPPEKPTPQKGERLGIMAQIKGFLGI